MEGARVKQHGEVGVDRYAAQPRDVRTTITIKAGAFNPPRDEHLTAAVLIDYSRCSHSVEPAPCHRLSELDLLASFLPVVHLGHETTTPLIHQVQRNLTQGQAGAE